LHYSRHRNDRERSARPPQGRRGSRDATAGTASEQIGGTKGVFALRPDHPYVRRLYQPAALPKRRDDDQIVPYADSAPLLAKLLKNGTLKTYKGFPHGMPTTQADTINADLLAFIKE
jgi:pimeloyl-ACP methyl ester carboxylesterase